MRIMYCANMQCIRVCTCLYFTQVCLGGTDTYNTDAGNPTNDMAKPHRRTPIDWQFWRTQALSYVNSADVDGFISERIGAIVL